MHEFLTPGVHHFVSSGPLPQRVLVQVWGGGGGAGQKCGVRGCDGGAGAFVQARLLVQPGQVLRIYVGAGGAGGVAGTVEYAPASESGADACRPAAAHAARERSNSAAEGEQPKPGRVTDAELAARGARRGRGGVIVQAPTLVRRVSVGCATGGYPGGGTGVSSGSRFAAGGGGGFSAVALLPSAMLPDEAPPAGFSAPWPGADAGGEEPQLLLLAAGGGGGGTRHGMPGAAVSGGTPDGAASAHENGDHDGLLEVTGGTAAPQGPGVGRGDGASSGAPFHGGTAASFGGGGGGGYFGGGSGGYLPGVVGGGGGGASYAAERGVLLEHDSIVMESGSGRRPGGLAADPPQARGAGVWDIVGGLVGEGGEGQPQGPTKPGNTGAVRIVEEFAQGRARGHAQRR